jgi:hypothetical protein
VLANHRLHFAAQGIDFDVVDPALGHDAAFNELMRVPGLIAYRGHSPADIRELYRRPANRMPPINGVPTFDRSKQFVKALERAVAGKARYAGLFNFVGSGKPKEDKEGELSGGNARGPLTVDAAFLEHWPRHEAAEERTKQSRDALDLYKKRAISRGTLSKVLYLNAAYELGYSPKSMYFLRGKNDGFPALSTTYLTRPPSCCEESKVGLVKAHLMKASLGEMATHYLGLMAEGRKGTKRARE